MTTRKKKVIPNPKKVLATRERQSATSLLLTEHFGPLAKVHPELWAHRTFLQIVGKVYEQVVFRDEISPKEFLELIKTLAESFKIDPKGHGQATQKGSLPEGGLADGLELVVRQLYGTNLQVPGENTPSPAPAITKTDEEHRLLGCKMESKS